MGIAITKLFAQLLFWLYELLDTVFEMFQVLCGIVPIDFNDAGEPASKTLIEIFLESGAVTKAFVMIFIVSIAVAGFAVILGILKSVINMKGGERKSHVKTLGQGLGTIISTLVMALVMVMGISLSNTILSKVYEGTVSEVNLSFSAQLFDMCVEKAYQYDWDNPKREEVFIYDENGEMIPELDSEGNVKIDEYGKIIYLTEKDSYGNTVYKISYDFIRDENGQPILITGWKSKDDKLGIYYSAMDLDFSSLTVDQVFGVHEKTLGLFENEDSHYVKLPMVELSSFNVFLAYLVVVIMLVAIIWTMLGLGKRVYDLVLLFIVLPLVSATVPLDDGARFKNWRETVVSKIVLAYGAVFAVNIFLLIMPVIKTIDFTGLGWSAFAANLFKMFLMMSGALSINGGQLLIARLMGTSAEENRDMAQSARALISGGIAAGGGIRGVKNLAVGGYNKYGKYTHGALPIAGKAGIAGLNLAGNAIGHEAYRRGAAKLNEKAGGIAERMRGLTHFGGLQKPQVPENVAMSPTESGTIPTQQATTGTGTTATSGVSMPKTQSKINPDVLSGTKVKTSIPQNDVLPKSSSAESASTVKTSGNVSQDAKTKEGAKFTKASAKEPKQVQKATLAKQVEQVGTLGTKSVSREKVEPQVSSQKPFEKSSQTIPRQSEPGNVAMEHKTIIEQNNRKRMSEQRQNSNPHEGLINNLIQKDTSGSGKFDGKKTQKGSDKK